jgi:hypothetical protein
LGEYCADNGILSVKEEKCVSIEKVDTIHNMNKHHRSASNGRLAA